MAVAADKAPTRLPRPARISERPQDQQRFATLPFALSWSPLFAGLGACWGPSSTGAAIYLADQLQRASTSIPLNVAEGAGEFSKTGRHGFTALRSAPRRNRLRSSTCVAVSSWSPKLRTRPPETCCCGSCPCWLPWSDGTPDRARAQARPGARRRKQPLSPEIPQLRKNCTLFFRFLSDSRDLLQDLRW